MFLELMDFSLFVNAGLMLFDRGNNNEFIAMLGDGSAEPLPGRAIGVTGTNLIITSNWNNILVLGEIQQDTGTQRL